MIENRKLLVGFDLCDDYSQISCYNTTTFEPESICHAEGEDKYLIPTVLGVKPATKEWYFGEDALHLKEQGNVELVSNILEAIRNCKTITVQERNIQPVALLETFLRKSLSLLKIYYPNDSIKMITFTLKQPDMNIRLALLESLEHLGLMKERVLIQSHAQSYIYYALSQKKELWMNDVGMFDFDEEGLHYSQISINRKTTPIMVGTAQKDYSATLNYELLMEDENKENVEYIFENIAKSVLHKQIVSTLYITGKGFEGNWADQVFTELCVGRRVFKGQNLYAKGACCTSKESAGDGKLKDYIFLSDEMITSNITIKAYHNAAVSEVILAGAGIPWFESDKKVDLILDGENEIEVCIKNIVKRDGSSQFIVLDGLPTRTERMTRVEVRAKFIDAKSCVITVKDKGFGEFYPSTNRIWEKIIFVS